MASTALKVAAGTLLVLALLASAGRYAAGALVASEGFRDATSRNLEKALRPFVPEAMVAVEESELSGLGEVVLRRVTVRSEQKIDAAVSVRELRVHPRWASVFWPGPTDFEASAILSGDGSARLVLSLPLKDLVRPVGDANAELTGAFEKADAPSLLALALATGQGRVPRLAHGLIDGELALSKSLGEDRATARKTGRATLRFSETAYDLKDRQEKLAPFEVVLDLRDFTVKISQPFLVETAAHDAHAIVGGALLLPHHAAQNVAWDLDLTADGKPGFKDDIAQAFRCRTNPESPRFRIVGPVADARCHAITAAAAKKDSNGL